MTTRVGARHAEVLGLLTPALQELGVRDVNLTALLVVGALGAAVESVASGGSASRVRPTVVRFVRNALAATEGI